MSLENAVVRGAVTIAIVLSASVGCLTGGPEPSETLTTLSPDAQHWFKIDWAAVPRADGTVRLEVDGGDPKKTRSPAAP